MSEVEVETVKLSWKLMNAQGRWSDELVEFEVTRVEHDHLQSLRRSIDELSPGPERSARIREIVTLFDLHARFPGMTHVEIAKPEIVQERPGRETTGYVTDALAAAEALEAKGFRLPADVKENMALGQLRLDAPGSTGLEAVQDELSEVGKNTVGKFHAPAAGAPATELASAIAVYPRSGTQRRKVLDAIHAAGMAGLTDEEISNSLKMLANTERPRRVELEEGGWIMDSGKKRKTEASGSDAVVWVLTEKGAREWEPDNQREAV